MSGLAKVLGSGTMSLYRYVESREDLLMLAADHALGPGPAPHEKGGQDRLRGWVKDLRRTYERHPWLTSMPVGTEPLLPRVLVVTEGVACLQHPVSGIIQGLTGKYPRLQRFDQPVDQVGGKVIRAHANDPDIEDQ